MNRSLLHRLPAIIALARERARELTAAAGAAPAPRPARAAGHPLRHDRPDDDDTRRVTLLCGEDLPVMLGLLKGRGQDGSLAGKVPLIWLAPTWPAATPPGGAAVPTDHAHTPRLLDFTVRLFVARELLTRNGLLATAVPSDPERCVEHLLGVVFGASRQVVPPLRPLHGPASPGVYLAGHLPERPLSHLGGSDGFRELAQQSTRRRDPVLVVPAAPASAAWVAALDRRWILVQPDAMGFALLREQVIALRMGLTGAVRARESSRRWATAP